MSNSEKIQAMIQRANLPPLPKVANVLIQLLGNPNATVREIAAVIRVDPALATRLLKVANSAAFGQRMPVTTPDRAAVVLGLSYVKAISLATQIAGPLGTMRAPAMDMQIFWRDSLMRACAARHLARAKNGVDPEHAFLIGLSQDIGVPLLACDLGEFYVARWDEFGAFHHRLAQWERKELGFTHADVTAALLKKWNLPEIIWRPIEGHHTVDAQDGADETSKLTGIAGFAGALPLGVVADPSDGAASAPEFERVMRLHGLEPEGLAELLRFAHNEFSTISSLFDDLLPDDCEMGRILCTACQCMTGVEPELFEAMFA